MTDLPERKRIRLGEYDYSDAGAYFVTICTKNKQCILSDIVGGGALDAPRVELTSYGKILDDEIQKSMRIYQHIQIDKYVIMPNHVHMIINILYNPNGTSRAPSYANGVDGTSRAPSRTNETIPAFVSILKRFTNKKCGEKIWHRSYYDHVIRTEHDYAQIWQYVDENPTKWESDEYYEQ